jgi:hypothetical protein
MLIYSVDCKEQFYMATEVGIRWYSWLILAFHLSWSAGILIMTHRPEIPGSLRWGVTLAWVVLTLLFGLYDFVVAKGATARGETDATPFDRWTIVHGLAGVVFGLWYIPLFYVLTVIVIWEAFEFAVAGFGDQEVIMNRLVDIGVALVGWLIVVLLAVAIEGTTFPLA